MKKQMTREETERVDNNSKFAATLLLNMMIHVSLFALGIRFVNSSWMTDRLDLLVIFVFLSIIANLTISSLTIVGLFNPENGIWKNTMRIFFWLAVLIKDFRNDYKAHASH